MLPPIKPDFSPVNLLGRLLFRRRPPWEQRRKAIILIYSVITGLILGGVCVAVSLFENGRH